MCTAHLCDYGLLRDKLLTLYISALSLFHANVNKLLCNTGKSYSNNTYPSM